MILARDVRKHHHIKRCLLKEKKEGLGLEGLESSCFFIYLASVSSNTQPRWVRGETRPLPPVAELNYETIYDSILVFSFCLATISCHDTS